MATLNLSTTDAQAMGTTLATQIGAGATIQIRSGAVPASPETAATGTLLATVTISGSFTSSGGVLTAADPAAASVVATGTAGYFRVLTSGARAVMDGDVGTTGASMNLSSTSLVSGGTVDLGVPSITIPGV